MKLTLEKITIINGKRIEYDYKYSKALSKYFSREKLFVEFDIDITDVPESMLVVPFLSNVLPISWFVGFDVFIDTIDGKFYESMETIKNVFRNYHSEIENRTSNLFINNVEENFTDNEFQKNAMLFSGGVDAYTTLFRHVDENLDLITIRGADISVSDNLQWDNLLRYNGETLTISENKKYYITSNIRDFITYEVDKLLPQRGWWGKIQHGLSLTCLTAPLSYLNNYQIIYIASSYTRKVDYEFIIWGSMPEIDDNVKWAETVIRHDAAELTRQEKIEYIANFKKSYDGLPLRVCYNEFKTALNCSVCEKCLRTIIALMISGVNPENYGFEINESIFTRLQGAIKNGFTNKGNRLFWKEIFEASCVSTYCFKDDNTEWREGYESFVDVLKKSLELPLRKTSSLMRLKFNFINAFPQGFALYLKFRRKML